MNSYDPREYQLLRQPVEFWQYLSIRYTERLAAAGIEASVGSRGDAYDNTLAKSVIGLFKTEVIRHAGPWRSPNDVEYATLAWVAWFNTCRLLEPLSYLPPAECEAQFDRLGTTPALAGVLN
jgi:putative transposase